MATVSGPGVPAGGWIQLDFMEAGMAWRGTWGFLTVGGTAVVATAAGQRDDQDDHQRDDGNSTQPPQADAQLLLALLGPASLLRPALVLRSALGLRLRSTGHQPVSVANQSQPEASTGSSGPAHCDTLGQIPADRSQILGHTPEVAVEERHGDVPTVGAELPNPGHPVALDEPGTPRGAGPPRRRARARAEGHRLGRDEHTGRGPAALTSKGPESSALR